MEPKRDYYEVLGVARDADQKTVKRAFLKLARTLHPDVNDASDAEDKFKEVNEAYGKVFESEQPARSCVAVAALPMGGLVEIEVVAHR